MFYKKSRAFSKCKLTENSEQEQNVRIKQDVTTWSKAFITAENNLCQLIFFSVFLQVMAVLLIPTQLLAVALAISLQLVKSTHGGVYYGIKQLPPQVPQYQALGQQVPHMPLGKEGIPMQHMGKEVPHMQYGKEYPHLPQYMKEVPQVPMLGKDMGAKKEKGRQVPHQPGPVTLHTSVFAPG